MEAIIKVQVADETHLTYVNTILDTIEKAAKIRGTGIAKRSPEYVKQKMLEGKAIIALCNDEFAGLWMRWKSLVLYQVLSELLPRWCLQGWATVRWNSKFSPH